MAFTGGTDGHLLRDLGGVLTCARSVDVDGFLRSVLQRTNRVVGLEKNIVEKCAMGTVVACKYIRYLPPSLRIHYEQNVPGSPDSYGK